MKSVADLSRAPLQLKAQATQAQRRQEALQRQLEAARSGAGFASASSVLGNQDRAAALPSQSSQGSYARGSSGSSGGADSSDNRPRGKLIGGPGYSGGRGAGSGSASGRAGGGIPEAAAAGMDEDDGEYAGVVFGGRGSSSSGQGSGSGSGSGSRAGSSGRAGQVAAAKPSRSRLIALDDVSAVALVLSAVWLTNPWLPRRILRRLPPVRARAAAAARPRPRPTSAPLLRPRAGPRRARSSRSSMLSSSQRAQERERKREVEWTRTATRPCTGEGARRVVGMANGWEGICRSGQVRANPAHTTTFDSISGQIATAVRQSC